MRINEQINDFESVYDTESQQSEQKKHFDMLMRDFEELNKADFLTVDSADRKELVSRSVDELKEVFQASGAEYIENVNDLYRSMQGEQLVVRREDPEKLVMLLGKGEPLPIGVDVSVGESYPNAVVWDYTQGSEGLQNAFLEGHAHVGGLVMVAGYRKGPHMNIEKPNNELSAVNGIRRDHVRILEGVIRPEDVAFVVVRIPASYVSEDQLTEREQALMNNQQGKSSEQKKVRQIYRGFAFNSPHAHEVKQVA